MIPAKPTGQDPFSSLLYNISLQLEELIGIAGKITTPTSTTSTTTTNCGCIFGTPTLT